MSLTLVPTILLGKDFFVLPIGRAVPCLSSVFTHPHSLPLSSLRMLLVVSLVVTVGLVFRISLAAHVIFGYIIVVRLPVILFCQPLLFVVCYILNHSLPHWLPLIVLIPAPIPSCMFSL